MMTYNAKTSGQGKVRPSTNRIVVSLTAIIAFLFVACPVFGQSSAQTTIQLGESVDPGSQVIVENMLAGNDNYASATMSANLIGGEELFFQVNGLENPLEAGQVVAVVQIVDGGHTRTFIIQGGGGSGGYIIGIEDL